MTTEYSFCETMGAVGPWHIRQLTKVGRKLGGGADTPTLCGLEAAWDINCAITDDLLKPHDEPGRPCPACTDKYKTDVT